MGRGVDAEAGGSEAVRNWPGWMRSWTDSHWRGTRGRLQACPWHSKQLGHDQTDPLRGGFEKFARGGRGSRPTSGAAAAFQGGTLSG